MTPTVFTTRDDLRSKLRDLLVDEVRQGVVDGTRAKAIAEDIIDELELSPEGETPLVIFERLNERYPTELGALKAKLDRAQHEQQDQDLARQMAEQIALGNFEGAVGLSRGKALETVVESAVVSRQSAEAAPAVAPVASVVEPVPTAPLVDPTPKTQDDPTPPAAPTPVQGVRGTIGSFLRRASGALAKIAETLERPAP